MFKIYKYNIRVVFCSLVSCVALFWYIYTPNIKYIPFSVDKILFVLFLGWTLFNRRWLFLRILSNKQVFIFLLLYIFVFVYTFALDLVVIDGFSTTYHVMQYAAQYIPFSIFLYLYMHSFFGEKTLEQLFKFLLLIVFAQSILGLFMLLDPDLKSFVYGIQSRNAGELYKGLLLRGNGFASGLMFSVPVIHCIVIGAIFFSRNFIPLTIKLLLLVLVVPVAVTNAKKIFPNIYYSSCPYDTAKECDALLIITDWNEFKQLDIRALRSIMKGDVIIDGRNIFEPEEMKDLGFNYFGIGR